MINSSTKTALTVISCLIMAVTIILTFTIYSINAKGNQEIEKYRTEELYRIKQSLKDHVNLAYATIDVNYKNAMDKAYLEKFYGRRLKSIIDISEATLKSKAEAVKKGELTLPEAQKQAKAEISKLRYDKNNRYVWINDTNLPYPKMIMHPITPSLNGSILDAPKYNSAMGKGQNLYVAAVDICQAHGKGFINYLWPKQSKNGLIPDVPMLAYTKLFSDWNWIIGTSVYIDEAVNDAIEKSKDDIRKMRYDNGLGYFWINSATKPNIKMIVHPLMPSLEEQILEGKLKELFESFVDISKQQNGGGFWQYRWPKPTTGGGLGSETPKLSYVKLYKPLGWIIGTGVYIDNIDKAVAEKQALVEEQITLLILKIVAASILIIILITIFSYFLNQYFFAKPQETAASETEANSSAPESDSVAQAAQTYSQTTPVSNDEVRAMAMNPKEMPMVTPNHSVPGTLRPEDCVMMVQEISKTLIAEQAKLLANAMQHNNNQIQKPELVREHDVTNEVKQLATETHQTIEDVKKMVEANQEESKAVNTVEIAKFNKVMGNLNKMVGDITEDLKQK